jgi:neopullulanase
MKNRCALRLFVRLVSLLALAAIAGAQTPVVRKIEPPNWWVNYTPEVTLLLTGENLHGAQIETASEGVNILDSSASENGHYLFVHVGLRSALEPGNVSLIVASSGGSANVNFPVSARENPAGHFQGVSRDDVIYLIMPDRFADGDPSNDQPPGSNGVYDRSRPMAYHGGDLRGIREHLSYLHDFGVTTLWLTPVWKNTDSDYHGYHVVDFYAIDPHMGTMAEYQALIQDAHKLGMKVLMDYVVNHTGPNHPWANDPPTATWFHGSPAHHLEPSYSFLGLVDPHAPPRENRNTLEGWFAGKLPDLNPDDPLLGTYLVQNALWWTEMAQLDGFRLDTFPYSSREFWKSWHARLHAAYPKINDIGEVSDSDPSITSFFEGGREQFDGIDTGLATVFDFPLCKALRDVVIRGAPMQEMIDVLRQDHLYSNPDMLVTFLGNHDQPRFVSQAGSSPAKLKAAFSLLLTMRGIPQIYSGDEIAMDGTDDPDNRHDFPGGFPGDRKNAFTAAGRTAKQQDVFTYVQSLLTLRRNHPVLRTGKQWHIGWDQNYYAFLRESPEEKLLIVYNNAATARALEIPTGDTPLEGVHRLETIFGTASPQLNDRTLRLSISAQSVALFRLE